MWWQDTHFKEIKLEQFPQKKPGTSVQLCVCLQIRVLQIQTGHGKCPSLRSLMLKRQSSFFSKAKQMP